MKKIIKQSKKGFSEKEIQDALKKRFPVWLSRVMVAEEVEKVPGYKWY